MAEANLGQAESIVIKPKCVTAFHSEFKSCLSGPAFAIAGNKQCVNAFHVPWIRPSLSFRILKIFLLMRTIRGTEHDANMQYLQGGALHICKICQDGCKQKRKSQNEQSAFVINHNNINMLKISWFFWSEFHFPWHLITIYVIIRLLHNLDCFLMVLVS